MLAPVQTYQSFNFDSYAFFPEEGLIELRYSLDDSLHFTETLQLPTTNYQLQTINFSAALQMLHLLGGISYYKTCCPKKIAISTEPLTKDQAEFFQAVYENGLGEFAYKNGMNLWGKIVFPHASIQSKSHKPHKPNNPTKYLVPIGGGKDSIVTIERLRAEGKDITLLRMGKHPLIDQLVEAMRLPCITVERTIAPELLKLNAEGALNGHVPITAYLSALAVVIAELYGFGAVVMSNEAGASEGNVEHFGRAVNHQWSKSAEAEEMIRGYMQKFINANLGYENPLREMTELQIVGEAVRYPQYFEMFTSCNANWKLSAVSSQLSTSRWCAACPKCAFAFLLFAAYLPKKEMMRIFGKNLFEQHDLLPLYRQLLGIEGFKPFECVGTPEECREALAMMRRRSEFSDTIVAQSL